MLSRWRRSVLVGTTALLLFAGGAVGPSGVVFAAPLKNQPRVVSCVTDVRCWGVARWFNMPSTEQIQGVIEAHCLWVADPSTNFVDDEMWQGTDNSTNLSYWIEAGETYGNPNGGTRSWFYARNRPSDGYDQWFPAGQVNLDQGYTFVYWYSGSNQWSISGPWGVSNLSLNPPYGQSAQAGTEITEVNNRMVGDISGLQYTDSSGHLHGGWSGAIRKNIPAEPNNDTTESWVGSGNVELSFQSSC